MDKQALRDFLEERRRRVTPEAAGVIRLRRQGRRGTGLSQREVDDLMHRAPGTYSRLIAGDRASPPFDLLRDAANVLVLSEQEWVALCRYARGEDPPAPLHERSGLEVPGMWQTAIDSIAHIAYVTDRSYNVLAHNDAYLSVHPDGGPANMMEWMLLHPKARTVLMDWETIWAPYVLPQLRAARAAHPEDATLARIEKDVHNDPQAGPLYEQRTGAQVHPDGNERPLLHPVHGPGWASICAAEPLSSPNARLMIVMFEPGAEPSTRRLPYLKAAP